MEILTIYEEVHKKMNTSQMKNIIVLKNLPSNLVDEAIVILKNNVKVKNKEIVENGNLNFSKENKVDSNELAIKEAENIIQNYIKNLERPKETKKELRNMNIKYKKLQISSFFLGIVALIGIIANIIK